MENPDENGVPRLKPYPEEIQTGSTYFWCACGRSAKQPFCDGSHADTEFQPIKIEPNESKTVYFCGCKKSANAPFCDGTHSKLVIKNPSSKKSPYSVNVGVRTTYF